jgi:hypothetical protein
MKLPYLLIGIGLSACLPQAGFGQASSVGDAYRPPVDNQSRDTTVDDIREAQRETASSKPSAKPKKSKGPAPASAADIVAGSQILDKKGVLVGTVDSVDADGVVVATASGRVKVPVEAFGKDSKGLVFGVTKAEFDQMVAGAGS